MNISKECMGVIAESEEKYNEVELILTRSRDGGGDSICVNDGNKVILIPTSAIRELLNIN